MRIDNLFGAALLAIGAAVPAAGSASTDRIFWSDFDPGVSAASETWTWIDVPGTHCGDNSATGFGVNLTTASDRVLIFLSGGGACWDATTCYLLKTATHFEGGYDATNFSSDLPTVTQPGSFLDRNDPTNPFKDYSYIAVPYCTGDVFAGNNVTVLGAKTAYFVGYENMTAYLKLIADTFPSAGRYVLAGASAGGFGAAYNWWQAQNAFPNVRVDMIDDSGTFMPEDVHPNFEAAQRSAWNLASTIPPGCSGCATAYDAVWPFYASVFPDNRGALLSYDPDSVLTSFFLISSASFSQGLAEEETNNFDPYTNRHYFVATGPDHVLWLTPDVTTKTVTLREFLARMVTDDAGWASVKP
jgi:hypothetical protein